MALISVSQYIIIMDLMKSMNTATATPLQTITTVYAIYLIHSLAMYLPNVIKAIEML